MRERNNEIRLNGGAVETEDWSVIRGPRIESPLQFGRYNENLSKTAASLLNTPFTAEPEYNAFATPLQMDTLVQLGSEAFSVRTRLCRAEDFVTAYETSFTRGEIHASHTIAPCLEAAALIDPQALHAAVVKRHQIAKPFSCELDLFVYTDHLPKEFSPDKERLMYAQIEVGARTIFVKGYPTDQGVSRVVDVDPYLIPTSASLMPARSSPTTLSVLMDYDSMPQEIRHEVLSDRKMQSYLLYEKGVFAAIELCEVGLLPSRMLAGYVARIENLVIRDLSQLFRDENVLRAEISSDALTYSENANILPIDFTLFSNREIAASFRMQFGWDKRGEMNLWKTQVKPQL